MNEVNRAANRSKKCNRLFRSRDHEEGSSKVCSCIFTSNRRQQSVNATGTVLSEVNCEKLNQQQDLIQTKESPSNGLIVVEKYSKVNVTQIAGQDPDGGPATHRSRKCAYRLIELYFVFSM